MCSGMCGYSATLEYYLDLHCHSVGSSWHSQSTAYPFHSGTLRGVRGRGTSTGVYRRRIRPVGGRTGAVLFKSNGPQGGLFPDAPPEEKVNPQKSSQDSRCGTKVNTQKGETGSESWWTLLWCLWRPPLPPWVVSFGVFTFLGTEGATW